MRLPFVYLTAQKEVADAEVALQRQLRVFVEAFDPAESAPSPVSVRPELHAAGAALELTVPGSDVVFSLVCVDRPGSKDELLWRLVAYRWPSETGELIGTLRTATAAGRRARRLGGARLAELMSACLERDRRGRCADNKAVIFADVMDADLDWVGAASGQPSWLREPIAL